MGAPMARTNARNRILASAIKLFAARGYDGVVVSDIALESGTSTGLVYYHFEDKQTLFDTAVQEGVRLLDEAVSRAMKEDVCPVERLRRFAHEYVALLSDHADLMRMLVRGFSADIDGPVPGLCIGRSVALIDRIEAVIVQGVAAGELQTVNPRLAAMALFAVVSTPITARALDAPVPDRAVLPLSEQASFMIDLVLKGIAPC